MNKNMLKLVFWVAILFLVLMMPEISVFVMAAFILKWIWGRIAHKPAITFTVKREK